MRPIFVNCYGDKTMTNKEQYEISSVGMGQVCHAYPLPSGRFQEAANLYGSRRNRVTTPEYYGLQQSVFTVLAALSSISSYT